MNKNPINLLPLDSPLLYYQLPHTVKRRCRALKNISLEQERLDITLRELMRQVCKKYSTIKPQIDDRHRTFISPFDIQSLRVVAKKADDLKELVSQTALKAAKLITRTNNLSSSAVRKVLDRCESKCHEVMTHLANIDWELYEFEESLSLYHADMEDAMTDYNMKLNTLYKRRLGIIRGEYEPTDAECMLPKYLDYSSPPKYLETERAFEILFSTEKNYPEIETLINNNRLLGVPRFWLQSLLIGLRVANVIEQQDYAALEYLVDVRYYYDTNRDCLDDEPMISDHKTQVLLFYFDKNPYFSNRILSKTLHIEKNCPSGRRMFDGLWVSKKEGCIINWNDGHDLTRIQTNSSNLIISPNNRDGCSGRMKPHRPYQRQPPCRSFFNFFSSRGLNYGRNVAHFNDDNLLVEVELDYDVFVRFRDFIVPHAIIAYSRGNLFGFECEHGHGENLSEKLNYLNTLFESPTAHSRQLISYF